VTASFGETGRESRPGLIRAEGAAGITPPRPLFSLCVRRVRLSPDGRHSLRGERMSYTKFGRGLALASAMAVGVAFAAPSAQAQRWGGGRRSRCSALFACERTAFGTNKSAESGHLLRGTASQNASRPLVARNPRLFPSFAFSKPMPCCKGSEVGRFGGLVCGSATSSDKPDGSQWPLRLSQGSLWPSRSRHRRSAAAKQPPSGSAHSR